MLCTQAAHDAKQCLLWVLFLRLLLRLWLLFLHAASAFVFLLLLLLLLLLVTAGLEEPYTASFFRLLAAIEFFQVSLQEGNFSLDQLLVVQEFQPLGFVLIPRGKGGVTVVGPVSPPQSIRLSRHRPRELVVDLEGFSVGFPCIPPGFRFVVDVADGGAEACRLVPTVVTMGIIHMGSDLSSSSQLSFLRCHQRVLGLDQHPQGLVRIPGIPKDVRNIVQGRNDRGGSFRSADFP